MPAKTPVTACLRTLWKLRGSNGEIRSGLDVILLYAAESTRLQCRRFVAAKQILHIGTCWKVGVYCTRKIATSKEAGFIVGN